MDKAHVFEDMKAQLDAFEKKNKKEDPNDNNQGNPYTKFLLIK